ncbi:hypothetical protein [Ciceribacter selenitireducens]|uniref:hypothetical protein n=1 Tax=Ciceribacter selenitireducens TaxID=448181 RepID=UPI0015F2511B|nr:hypothetical protein [Ciceribacter selenitireducens]
MTTSKSILARGSMRATSLATLAQCQYSPAFPCARLLNSQIEPFAALVAANALESRPHGAELQQFSGFNSRFDGEDAVKLAAIDDDIPIHLKLAATAMPIAMAHHHDDLPTTATVIQLRVNYPRC